MTGPARAGCSALAGEIRRIARYLAPAFVVLAGCDRPPPQRLAADPLQPIASPSPAPPSCFATEDFSGGSAYPGPVTVDLVDTMIARGS